MSTTTGKKSSVPVPRPAAAASAAATVSSGIKPLSLSSSPAAKPKPVASVNQLAASASSSSLDTADRKRKEQSGDGDQVSVDLSKPLEKKARVESRAQMAAAGVDDLEGEMGGDNLEELLNRIEKKPSDQKHQTMLVPLAAAGSALVSAAAAAASVDLNKNFTDDDSEEICYFTRIRVPELDDPDQTSRVTFEYDEKKNTVRILDNLRGATLSVRAPFAYFGAGCKSWPLGNAKVPGRQAGDHDPENLDKAQLNFQMTLTAYSPDTADKFNRDVEVTKFRAWCTRLQKLFTRWGITRVPRMKRLYEKLKSMHSRGTQSMTEADKEKHYYELFYKEHADYLWKKIDKGGAFPIVTDDGTAFYVQDYVCETWSGASAKPNPAPGWNLMNHAIEEMKKIDKGFKINQLYDAKMNLIQYYDRFNVNGASGIGKGSVMSLRIDFRMDGNDANSGNRCGLKANWATGTLALRGVTPAIQQDRREIKGGDAFDSKARYGDTAVVLDQLPEEQKPRVAPLKYLTASMFTPGPLSAQASARKTQQRAAIAAPPAAKAIAH